MIRTLDLSSIQKVREFISTAMYYEETILVRKNDFVVDGHSILGVLSLGDLSEVQVEFVSENDEEANKFFKAFSSFEATRQE